MYKNRPMCANGDDYTIVYSHEHNNARFYITCAENFYWRFSRTQFVVTDFSYFALWLLFIAIKSFILHAEMICNVLFLSPAVWTVTKSAWFLCSTVSCISICRALVFFLFFVCQCVTKEYFFFIQIIFVVAFS